jgi:hypothetical protein
VKGSRVEVHRRPRRCVKQVTFTRRVRVYPSSTLSIEDVAHVDAADGILVVHACRFGKIPREIPEHAACQGLTISGNGMR